MKFWDSSALVPLITSEARSAWSRQMLKDDREALVWCLSAVEVRSALARQLREGSLSSSDLREAKRRAERLFAELIQVIAFDIVRDRALRLLDLHDLRAADALQLAAALIASEERPGTLPFVTLDSKLAEAAEREGFPVLIS
jgi:hypothetical protein